MTEKTKNDLQEYIATYGMPLVLRWLKSAATRYNAEKARKHAFPNTQNQQLRSANEVLRNLSAQDRRRVEVKILNKLRNSAK